MDDLGWSLPPAAAGGVYARPRVLLVVSTSPGKEDPTLDLLNLSTYSDKMLKDLSVL